MTRDALYIHALDNKERTVHELASLIDSPQWTLYSRSADGVRYAEKGAIQAIVQKVAGVVSGRRAAYILLKQGYAQEHAALFRMADESSEDITFLLLGMIHGETDQHREFLEDCCLEEFDDASRSNEQSVQLAGHAARWASDPGNRPRAPGVCPPEMSLHSMPARLLPTNPRFSARYPAGPRGNR